MDAKTVLDSAVRSGLSGLRLEPGLNERAVADLSRRLGVPIPPATRALLLCTTGFYYEPFGSVSFVGVEGFEFEAVCPKSIALAGDGAGNFAVVDIDCMTGLWGKVFFMSHDPPVVVIQAADVAEFTEQVLAVGRSGQQQALGKLAEIAVCRVWREEPYLVGRDEALASEDALVATFAAGVPESFGIADLRRADNGAGFAWGRAGPAAKPRRCGTELLFAADTARKRSLLGRFFRKRRRH